MAVRELAPDCTGHHRPHRPHHRPHNQSYCYHLVRFAVDDFVVAAAVVGDDDERRGVDGVIGVVGVVVSGGDGVVERIGLSLVDVVVEGSMDSIVLRQVGSYLGELADVCLA